MGGVDRPRAKDSTLHLPRILSLHGGGTNDRIFRAQCSVLERKLKSTFRFCYARAPFPSEAGPDVLSVYERWGPFRRWLRWLPDHPEIDAHTAVEEIDECLKAAMEEDDRKGATGEWVGLLGFSQGAKMCASLLYRQQIRIKMLGKSHAGFNYHFAVLFAGRAPLVSLESAHLYSSTLPDASQSSTDELGFTTKANLLHLPTIHVHGLKDKELHLHQQLLDQCCAKGSTRLVEWDGEHRMPIKTRDVNAVVDVILAVARETGVLTF